MYLEHFGLGEPPFTITPHTEFFFAGANRGATLAALVYTITHGEGIVKVSGEVGSGKTMLCRVLMERLPESVATIYLAIPSLNRDEMLAAICADLGVTVTGHTPVALIRGLQEHLLRLHMDGKRVVALIDEAHAMPLESLEEIRLLSNLETNKSKLLQIVLFGQPELDEHLAMPQMRQLRERITHSFNLSPLSLDDVHAYLRHRLAAAGYKGAEVFSPACVKRIAKASEGLSRRINIIADKSLLAAFSHNTHAVLPAHVEAAIKDCDFASVAQAPSRAPWLVATALAAGLVIGALGMGWATKRTQGVAVPVGATAKPGVPVEQPVAADPTPTASAASVAANPPAAAAGAEARPEPAPTPPAAMAAMSDHASLTERLAAAGPWLAQENNAHWVIQLMLANAGEVAQLQLFIDECERSLGAGRIHAYGLIVNGVEKVSVVYSGFTSREAAFRALETLPPRALQFKPYPRALQSIRNEAQYEGKPA